MERNRRQRPKNMERNKRQRPIESWTPKTSLGKKVMSGEITSIEEIFKKNYVIKESGIIDFLVPNLEDEIIFIGGMPGKGGGKKRTPLRITTRMHQSGRKRTLHALVAVGNKNGLLGIGYATGKDALSAITKASTQAKLNIIPIRRGCGSWECECKGAHSIPFKTRGKVGSVLVQLIPAPRGINLCVAPEIKKLMRLSGIRDLWAKSRGQTDTRINFIMANFSALKNLNRMKTTPDSIKTTGMLEGPDTTITQPEKEAEEEPKQEVKEEPKTEEKKVEPKEEKAEEPVKEENSEEKEKLKPEPPPETKEEPKAEEKEGKTKAKK